jgi:uncharacterized protein (DUF433 family)
MLGVYEVRGVRPVICFCCGQERSDVTRTHAPEVYLAKRGDSWMWSRYLMRGTRLKPGDLAVQVRAGRTIEQVADDYLVTDETVQAAVDWYDKRSRRKKTQSGGQE